MEHFDLQLVSFSQQIVKNVKKLRPYILNHYIHTHTYIYIYCNFELEI